MATYSYECHECGEIKDVNHKMNESPIIKCDLCKIPMYKVITGGIGISFNGDWFKNKGKY